VLGTCHYPATVSHSPACLKIRRSYMHMMSPCIYSLWRTRTWTICKPSFVFHDNVWMVPKHCMVADQTHRAPCVTQHALCMREMYVHVSSTGETCMGIWGYTILTRVAVHKLQNTLESNLLLTPSSNRYKFSTTFTGYIQIASYQVLKYTLSHDAEIRYQVLPA